MWDSFRPVSLRKDFANEDERAREDIEKQHPQKDGKRPAVLAEKERSIGDEEFQLAHEIEGDGEQEGK